MMFVKMKRFVKENQKELLKMAVMVGVVLITPHTGHASATSQYAWNNAFTSFRSEVTGPLPKILGVIAVAGSGLLWMWGDMGPVAKKLMGMVFAISMAIGAPMLAGLVTGDSSGLLF